MSLKGRDHRKLIAAFWIFARARSGRPTFNAGSGSTTREDTKDFLDIVSDYIDGVSVCQVAYAPRATLLISENILYSIYQVVKYLGGYFQSALKLSLARIEIVWEVRCISEKLVMSSARRLRP